MDLIYLACFAFVLALAVAVAVGAAGVFMGRMSSMRARCGRFVLELNREARRKR